jgi:ADP-ribose pyrophosphatase YjhB (NUDIX family)
MVDDGETIEDALVREVKEEADVGILAKNIQLISSGHAVKDGLNIVWLFFVGNTPDKTVTLSYEHDKLEWMTLVHGIETFEYPRHKELLQHIRDNQLQP